VSDTAIAIVLAVSAGFAYALASVLQQRAASEAAPELSLRPGLLLALVKRPLWVFGTLVDGAAYALEAASLGFGSIIVVQPLLVSGLLWALPLVLWTIVTRSRGFNVLSSSVSQPLLRSTRPR